MKKGVKITLGIIGVTGLGALTYFVLVPKIKKIMFAKKCKKYKGRIEGDSCLMGSWEVKK